MASIQQGGELMPGEKQAVAVTPRLRGAASIGFLVLHVLGGAYALVMAAAASLLWLLLKMVMTHNPLFQRMHLPATVVPVGLILVALLAAMALRRRLWRRRRRQPEPDLALHVRALVYFALACVFVDAFFLSTPETFAGPFRVRFPIIAYISAAFAYGAYALWSLLLPSLRRAFPDRLRHGLDVLGMNVALLLVLAEVGLRVLAAFWPSPLLATASPSAIRREANRERPGTVYAGFPMNSGGHYDTEFVPRSATSNRIVVDIGDSFSYGVVPHYFHFTTVAERELPGVEIYNMGYSGIGPGDYLYLLEHEALPLDPELVVINLFIGNDVTDGSPPPSPVRWYDADRYLLAIVWHRLQIMKRAKLVDAAAVTTLFNLTPQELVDGIPHLAKPLLETPSVSDDIFFGMETRSAQVMCRPDQGLYPAFFETLAKMKRATGRVPLAFMLIPEEYQVEDDIWHEVVRRNEQPLDRDLAQRTMVAWLKAHGLPVLDLLPVLRAVQPMRDGRRHLYHLRNMHFNTRGNDVTGQALAAFVASLLPPPVVHYTRRASLKPRPPLSTPASPLPALGARHARGASPEPARPPPAPLSLPFHLVFGESATRRWMPRGWYDAEGAGRATLAWSAGDRSVLTVPLPRGGDIRVDFEALPFVFPHSPEQAVTVALNGTVIEKVRLHPGRQWYSVVLPAGALRASLDTLEFSYAYALSPQEVLHCWYCLWGRSSPDIRTLAVAWYSLDFSERKP